MAPKRKGEKVVWSNVPRATVLYCSICGIPMLHYNKNRSWLNDIVVMHGDPAREVLLDNVDRIKKSSGPDMTAIYDAWLPSIHPGAIPMHNECLKLTETILESSCPTALSLQKGGPPTSLLDVYRVLIARAVESRRRTPSGILSHILSPSEYGGIACCTIYKSRQCGHIPKQSLNALLADAMHIQFPVRHAQKSTPKWPLPVELVHLIFEYALQDLSGPCNYIFPEIMWQKQLRKFVWMRDLAIPDDIDYEQLVRQAWQIENGAILVDAAGLTNRWRIWKIIGEMRFNDSVDIRAHYCRCMNPPRCLDVWDGYTPRWCAVSWPSFRQRCGLSREWRPIWRDLQWIPPRFNEAGDFELYWDPESDDEVDVSLLRDFE